MFTVSALQALHRAGRLAEARAAALQPMAAADDGSRQAGAPYVIYNIAYDLFPDP